MAVVHTGCFCQVITPHTLNTHNFICQLCLSKVGKLKWIIFKRKERTLVQEVIADTRGEAGAHGQARHRARPHTLDLHYAPPL